MVFRIFVWIMFLFGGVFLGFYLDNKFFKFSYNNIWLHIIFFIIGLFILKIVLKISKNTGRTLAKYGRQGNIPRMETNRLVTNGVYNYMRHPMHLGLMLFPFAVAFLTGLLSFILIIAPIEVIIILIMIKFIEEPEAYKKFGKQYLDYIKQTPAFCLKKECIKALLSNVDKNK